MQVRVLIVEDKLADQILLQREFEKLGCKVDVVNNVDDALLCLNDNSYQLMTVDNELKIHYVDEPKNEGLRLVNILYENSWLGTFALPQALRCIVITSLTKHAKLVNEMQKREVRDYVFKPVVAFDPNGSGDEGAVIYQIIEDLKHHPVIEIHSAFEQQHIQHLRVDWSSYWPVSNLMSSLVGRLLTPPETLLAERKNFEFQLLLERLFPGSTQINLKPIQQGFSSTQVFEVHYFIGTTRHPRAILKVGSYAKIAQEYDHWTKYIKNKPYTAQIQRFERTQMFGGIVYQFLGGTPDEFPEFGRQYHQTSLEDLKLIIHHLFEVTCSYFYDYSQGQAPVWVSLLQIYDETLNFRKYSDLIQETGNKFFDNGLIHREGDNIYFQIFETDNRNPELILPDVIARLSQNPKLRQPIYVGISHGDMNESNIRIQAQLKQAWLIDFQQTDEHHSLRDFVQLEMIIKLMLLPIGNLKNYFQLESLLLKQFLFDQPHCEEIRRSYTPPNSDYAKAFELILEIRYLASLKVPSRNNENYEDYFTALMLYNYNAIRYFEERCRDSTKEISELDRQNFQTRQLAALLSASLIAKRVQIF